MHRFYLTIDELKNGCLLSEEFLHATQVLRIKENSDFIGFCGDNYDYLCNITKIEKKKLFFEVKEKTINIANPQLELTLFQGLAKGEKLELITQKLTEIGASKIVPVYFKNCDVKFDSSKPNRLNKITINACKQCGRSKPIIIENTIKIEDLIKTINSFDYVFFAYEKETENNLNTYIEKIKNDLKNNINFNLKDRSKNLKIAIIIGPEGGFTPQEAELLINNQALSISLGKRILRTETAAIYLSSILIGELETYGKNLQNK